MALSWYLFIPAYYFLAAMYLLFGVHNTKFIKCVLKCLPVISLMFQMLAVLVDYTGSVHSRFGITQLLWGIAFSVVGDGCLVFRTVWFVGVASFGVSLCFYISMLGFVESVFNIGFAEVACGLGVFLLSLTIHLVFRSQTNKARTKPLPVRSIVSALILFYFSVLSTLLWSAAVLLLRQKNLISVCSTVGAAMFYASDVLIVASAVWDARLLQGRALVMITYYTAQLFLAISVALSLQ